MYLFWTTEHKEERHEIGGKAISCPKCFNASNLTVLERTTTNKLFFFIPIFSFRTYVLACPSCGRQTGLKKEKALALLYPSLFRSSVERVEPFVEEPDLLSTSDREIEGEGIGDRVYEIREKSGLSQEAFGKIFGVSKQAVSKWELYENRPSYEKWQQLLAYERKLDGVSVEASEENKKDGKALKSKPSPWITIGFAFILAALVSLLVIDHIVNNFVYAPLTILLVSVIVLLCIGVLCFGISKRGVTLIVTAAVALAGTLGFYGSNVLMKEGVFPSLDHPSRHESYIYQNEEISEGREVVLSLNGLYAKDERYGIELPFAYSGSIVIPKSQFLPEQRYQATVRVQYCEDLNLKRSTVHVYQWENYGAGGHVTELLAGTLKEESISFSADRSDNVQIDFSLTGFAVLSLELVFL